MYRVMCGVVPARASVLPRWGVPSSKGVSLSNWF
jgi:hypothetical protein